MSQDPDVSAFDESAKARRVAEELVRYLKRPAEDPPRPVWHVEAKEIHRGTKVEPLIHGDAFGDSVLTAIDNAKKYVFLIAWAIDPSFRLRRAGKGGPGGSPSSSSIVGALRGAMTRGVVVRVLEWRNLLSIPSRQTNFSLEILRAEGISTRITLDVPVLHQKLVAVDGAVAFCGGMDPTDLGGDRWDTREHLDDDHRRSKPSFDAGPWHDVQARLEGDAVVECQRNFVERWDEGLARNQNDELPPLYGSPPRQAGSLSVQVIRTIPSRDAGIGPSPLVEGPGIEPTDRKRHAHEALRQVEEYSTLESYGRAIVNARRFIYIENQYFTCKFLVDLITARLRAAPELSLVVLVPRQSELAVAEQDALRKRMRAGFFRAVAAEQNDAAKVVGELRAAARPDQVFIAYPTNKTGTNVYVHAKVMIVDDQYATIGSANFTYRSMFRTDQELGVAWIDPKGTSVRAFRRQLWREHLDLDDKALADKEKSTASMARLWRERSEDPNWKEKNRRIHVWSPPPAKGS
jgi:phosphatidylserine/phosphatidylglycerophosphate/cardiolipin synthase-like enzyme